MLEFQPDPAHRLPVGNVHRHKRHLHAGGAAGVLERIRDIFHRGVQLFQLCGQLFPFVGAGVAQGFGVEQAAHLAAVLHDVQRFEQVPRTL